jgi:hypothetical protein
VPVGMEAAIAAPTMDIGGLDAALAGGTMAIVPPVLRGTRLASVLWIRIHFFRIRIHKFFFGFGYRFGSLD